MLIVMCGGIGAYVYSLDKSEVKAYVGAIELTEEYISLAKKDENRRFKLREQVLKKFVYFWEFWNKGLHGRSALEREELLVVKPLFFSMMENGFLINIRYVEAGIRSYRDKELWKILTESNGAKIDQVHAILLEEKSIKSAEDKVRNFIRWLNKQDSEKFSKATISLLEQLIENINGIKNGK